MEKACGKRLGLYYTMGQYDGVVMVEAPNEIVQTLLVAKSLGNVRTTTLKAFPEAEALKIMEKLP